MKYPPFEADKPFGMCHVTITAVGVLDFPFFHHFSKKTAKKKNFHQQSGLGNLRKKLVKWYVWSTTWTLWKVDQKYLESFEMRF